MPGPSKPRAEWCVCTDRVNVTLTPDRSSPAAMRGVGALIALVIVLATPAPAHATWQNFRKAQDGLPGDWIYAIAQGTNGEIAFATDRGVGVFDGDHWRSFTDSLPSPFAKAVLQDRRGDWWVGTEQGGLARFNGVSWKLFGSAQGNLPSDRIRALLEDGAGDLWVGTDRGLARYRPSSGTWDTLATARLPSPDASVLFEDSRQRLWVVSRPHGVTMADPTRTTWTRYLQDPLALAQDSVFSIGEDRDGGIWFGTFAGAWRLDPGGSWRAYSISQGLPAGDLTGIARDSLGGLWIAGGTGIARFDGRTFRRFDRTPNGTSMAPAYSLLVDGPGNVWVGTLFQGAFRTDRVGFEDYIAPGASCQNFQPPVVPVHTTEIASNCLTAMLQDHEGDLWFATADSGVARLDHTGAWSAVRERDGGVASDSVSALFEDRAGNLWFGTSGTGLSRLDPARTQWATFDRTGGLAADSVATLFVDASGTLWVGTRDGASRRVGNGWSSYLRGGFGGVVGPTVVEQIVEDTTRTIWLRTSEGLWSIDQSRLNVTRHGVADGLPDDRVNALLRGADGTLWVGSDGGVAHLASGAWTVWTQPEIGSGSVLGLTQDRQGRVWAAQNSGVSYFDGGSWRPFDASELGLAPVTRVFEDSHSRIWLVSGSGLGTWNDSRWRSFGHLDGLASNGLTQLMEDSQGRLWGMADGGLTQIGPDRVGPQTIFRLPQNPITTSRYVSFVFGAAYGEAADVEFQPVWNGMAEAWSSATTWSLNNVADGIHTFEVRSRDWYRNLDPSPATVTFEIDATPPQAIISAPRFGQPVRGRTAVVGSSVDARYASQRVDVRQVGTTAWTNVAASRVPVDQDTLCLWDTSGLADGDWEVRLSVTDSLGLVGPTLVRVIVDNVAPFANVTSPVLIRAADGGDVFTTDTEVHLYIPPHGFDGDANVTIDRDTSSSAPTTLPDGAVRQGDAWTIGWTGARLVKDALLEMRSSGTEASAIYVEATPGNWTRLGGTSSGSGAPLSLALTAPGRYAVFTGGSGAPSGALGVISLVPRAFSPQGTFGSRDVAISFTIGRPGAVTVKVYNRAGRLMRTVADGLSAPAGSGLVRWDGRDREGRTVNEGLYLVTVEALGSTRTRTLEVLH